jgi:L-aspartate oxidase
MGANRLASNSLLDGMVFAPRVVEAIGAGKDAPDATGAMRSVLDGDRQGPNGIGGRRLPPLRPIPPGVPTADVAKERDRLQRGMFADAGVLRSAASLAAAGVLADEVLAGATSDDGAGHELHNLATVARALIAAATAREESRGAHARIEFPETKDELRLRLTFG